MSTHTVCLPVLNMCVTRNSMKDHDDASNAYDKIFTIDLNKSQVSDSFGLIETSIGILRSRLMSHLNFRLQSDCSTNSSFIKELRMLEIPAVDVQAIIDELVLSAKNSTTPTIYKSISLAKTKSAADYLLCCAVIIALECSVQS